MQITYTIFATFIRQSEKIGSSKPHPLHSLVSIFRFKTLPKRFRIGQLLPEYADLVYDRWTSHRRTSDRDYWIPFIRRTIELSPSVCIYDDTNGGIPVSWGILSLEGTTGFGFTEKLYRGNSLSTISLLAGIVMTYAIFRMHVGYIAQSNTIVRETIMPRLHLDFLQGEFQFLHHIPRGKFMNANL